MTPRQSPDDLLSYDDIARALNVEAVTIRAYRSREQGGLPAPDGRVGQSPFWKRSTIAPWIRSVKRARAKGGPRA